MAPVGKILEDRVALCVAPFPRRILASLRPSTGSVGHFWDALVMNNSIFSKQEAKRFHPSCKSWGSGVNFTGNVLASVFLVLASRPPFLPPRAVLVKRNWKHPGQDLSSSLFTASLGPLRRRRVNFKLISIRFESDRIDIQLEIPGVGFDIHAHKGVPPNTARHGNKSADLFGLIMDLYRWTYSWHHARGYSVGPLECEKSMNAPKAGRLGTRRGCQQLAPGQN